MQMAGLASAMRMMPREVADRFKVVFVTVDPSRDKPRELRSWLNQFDKGFIGLTGNRAEVEAAQAAAKIPPPRGDPSKHATLVLAYTKDDLAHVIYPAGVTQGDWLDDLPKLAAEAGAAR
jgi:protein SCO1/2